jgi:hypothetical protein
VIDRGKAIVIAAGSVGATAVLFGLVFSLGGWAYRQRQCSLHDGRLRRLVADHPSAERVSKGVLAEPGNRPIATPSSEAALRELAERIAPGRADEVVAKARRFKHVQVFGVRDVVYFLYFDDEGLLQDYVLATP